MKLKYDGSPFQAVAAFPATASALAPAFRTSDTELTGLVEPALERNAHTEDHVTDVTARNGEVSLHGTVDGGFEKKQAGRWPPG